MKRKEKGKSFFQIMLKIVDITRLFGFSSPTPSSPFLRGKGEGKFFLKEMEREKKME